MINFIDELIGLCWWPVLISEKSSVRIIVMFCSLILTFVNESLILLETWNIFRGSIKIVWLLLVIMGGGPYVIANSQCYFITWRCCSYFLIGSYDYLNGIFYYSHMMIITIGAAFMYPRNFIVNANSVS